MIFVTRPSPQGEALTKLLNQANLQATHLPLFRISAGKDLLNLQNDLNQLLPNDIVIAVSPQVANVITTFNPHLNFPKHLQYFAIGNKTAELIRQLVHKSVSFPKQENSEGLLALFDADMVKNRKVLILRGDSGRQLIADSLSAKQAQVKLVECYSRHAISYPFDILSNSIEHQLVIITSIEHLHQLELYCQTEHKKQACLVVTSLRIFEEAKRLNWQNIVLAKSANNQILFKKMISLCHNNINYIKSSK